MKDKYKNKSKSMRLVAESLNEFALFENMEEAKKVFSNMGFDENSAEWQDFEKVMEENPDIAEKFVNWASGFGEENFLEELNDILDSFKEAKEEEVDIKEINKFASLRDYEKNIQRLIFQKKKEKLDKNIEDSIDQKEEKFKEKISKPTQLQLGGFGKSLYVYGVLIKTRNETYVKFGDTRQNNIEDAKKYALDATIGKARGIVKDVADSDIEKLEKAGKEVDDISLIFVKDVTEFAREEDPDFIQGNRMGFDNYLRDQMPGISKVITNPKGGRSLELHKHPSDQTDLEIIRQWKRTLEDVLDRKKHITAKKTYTARPFHNEMNKKIVKGKSDKHLLGAATGAGKEAVTLASLIYINDNRSELFNDDTIHVSTATIPATELELFEELSNVDGMKMGDGSFIEFSRIKPYCLEKFANSYQNKLTPTAFKWFKENVEIVKNASDIPKKTAGTNEVTVLFGSFIHLGRQAKPTGDYNNLGSRIGILSVGEGHQFLSSGNNKLWNDIKENFKYKFLFLITGTPYDFIFNEAGHLYFSPEERTLFTRNDLYKAKEDGEEAFKQYPKLNYYKLDTQGVIEEMKKDPRWEDDKHGFTWEKFLKYDTKEDKFNYEQLIIQFFNRLLFVDDFSGEPDNLSIENAPELSDYAKKHIIVALPVGGGGVGVATYIPKLVELLTNGKGFFGNYKAFQVYDEKDSLSDLKEHIELEKSPTILFTCNKLLTGTNIPQWGSLVFLRPIGGSIKFFEQATGRVGRPFDDKETVGIFLGNLELAAEISIVVDEKIGQERGENLETSTIINQTLKNYNWFGTRNGKWEKFNMDDLVAAQEALAGNIDYGVKLALGNPHPPENFDLEFKSTGNIVRSKIDIDSQDNKGAKNKERIEKHKQLALKFEKSKNPEQMWKNMIEEHIPKLLIIALLNDKHTIKEVGDLIEKAIEEDNSDILDMVGEGVYYIPDYINDKDQINMIYLDRWIGRLIRKSSKKEGMDGFKERYNLINEELKISRFESNIVLDPLSATNEIVNNIVKLSGSLKGKNIFIVEKNGSFTYSILEKIGYANSKDLTIGVLNKLSEHVIQYIFGNKKLNKIKYIKDIKDIEKMGKFDVVIGNPPFQGPKEGSNSYWKKFIKSSLEMLKDDAYLCYVSPNLWLSDNKIGPLMKQKQIKYVDLSVGKYFQGIGSSFCYFIIQNNPYEEETIIRLDDGKTINVNLLEDKYLPVKNINEKSIDIFNKFYKDQINFNQFSAGGRHRDFSKEKSTTHKYPAYHTKSQPLVYTKQPQHLKDKKVIYQTVSSFEPFYDDGNIGVGRGSNSIFVNNKEEGENLLSYLNSKLFKFVQENSRQGGWFGMKMLPEIDISKKWSDKELYDYFNLTQEEIDYIESNVK